MAHYDWMLRVYEWMGTQDESPNVIQEVMNRWIDIKKGFLQGDTYSVGFYCMEIPVMILLIRWLQKVPTR